MFEEDKEKFLIDIRNSGTVILVEGKKDRAALEMAGLDKIIEISGKRLEDAVDVIKTKYSQVAILTDYDKEGVKQYKRLKKLFLANDVKVDDNIRRKFKRNFLVNKIEELNGYFK